MSPKLSVTARYRLSLLADVPRAYRATDLNMIALHRRGFIEPLEQFDTKASCLWALTTEGRSALQSAVRDAETLHALTFAS